MSNPIQTPPFTLQIDLTEGCNISVDREDGTKGLCWACGLNGIRQGPGNYKFMTEDTAREIAKQIKVAGWNCQLLFAGFGEPSMNPKFIEIIKIFRMTLTKQYMVMLSNGAGFVRAGNIKRLFDAGISTLALEDYEGGLMNKINIGDAGMEVLRYPSNKEANPHHRSTKKRLVVIDDITSATKGTHAVLNNHAGIGLPPQKVQARCAKPFREMSVKWDGHVSICCIDWRRETDFGNIHKNTLYELWNSDVFNAARRILITGERNKIRLCSRCDHPSYRVGLLPDKFGKVKLDPYTPADVLLVSEAEPETTARPIVVLRPWEKPFG